MSTTDLETASDVTLVGVDAVQTHPRNARVGDVDAIAASLQRFGQMKPIVVQKSTGYVIAGNHTLLAARRLGWAQLQAVVADISDEAALAYLLADNRTSDKARYNDAALYGALESVLDLGGTGFTAEDVETLADSAGATVIDDGVGGVPQHIQSVAQEARAAARTSEPLRDIVLLMTAAEAATFGANISKLQKALGLTTVKDTVNRVVGDAAAALGY